MRKCLLAVALTGLLVGTAQADTVVLKNGARIEGEVEEAPGGLRVKVPGGHIDLPSHQVKEVERGTSVTPRVDFSPPPRPRLERRSTRSHMREIRRRVRQSKAPIVLPNVTDKSVRSARYALERGRERSRARLGTRAHRAKQGDVAHAARVVRACYEAGVRDAADELIAAHPQLYTWDSAPDSVDIDAVFDGKRMRLSLRNTSNTTLAVSFPPGTYGIPLYAQDGKKTPRHQDLGFLRSNVIVLAPRSNNRQVTVPIACAAYHKDTPTRDMAFALRAFPRGTAIDRLMQVLCSDAGRGAARDAEIQLAIWIARQDVKSINWGSSSTFATHQRINRDCAPAAGRLLQKSGIDPREHRMFEGSPEIEPQPPARPQEPASAEDPSGGPQVDPDLT